MATYTSGTGLTLDDTDPDDRKIIERQRKAARESGRSGGDRASVARDRADLGAAFDEGAAEVAAPAKPAAAPKGANAGKRAAAGAAQTVKALPTPRLRPPRTANLRDASGFALGVVLHALVVSYIRYGAAGPRGWLSAKFLNKPIQGSDLNGPTGPNGEEAAEGQIDPSQPII